MSLTQLEIKITKKKQKQLKQKAMESKTNLVKAIIKVMNAVKNIEKAMTVGTGNNSYKGVSDKDVKYQIGKAMEENGLAMIPIDIKPSVQIDRWEADEWDSYKKKEVKKQKQSVFTEVVTKYLLIHESGESIEVSGYGHGVDSQDKSAGKATTYALKNALLYTFLVPTGEIDDTDKTHSDSVVVPPSKKEKPKLTDEGYAYLIANGTEDDINKALKTRSMTEAQEKDLKSILTTKFKK